MNVWWQFNKTDKLLVIGVNNTSLGNVVTETYDQLPWLTVLGGGTTQAHKDAARAMVESVATPSR